MMEDLQKKPRQRFLALDTSTAVMAASVMEDHTLLEERNERAERNHSVHVVPVMEQLLAASGTQPGQLDGIAVGIGPGSYTGIRIAVTAAKTLAWAWDIPVAGVSSLQAMAWGGWHHGLAAKAEAAAEEPAAAGAGGTPSADEGSQSAAPIHWIVPLVDARRGQAYTALFASAGSDAPRRLEPDAIRKMDGWLEALAARIAEAAPEELAAVWLVGDAVQLRLRLRCAAQQIRRSSSFHMSWKAVGSGGLAPPRCLQVSAMTFMRWCQTTPSWLRRKPIYCEKGEGGTASGWTI